MPENQRAFPQIGVPFTLREALQHGLTREQLRNRKYDRPFRGVRVLESTTDQTQRTLSEEISYLARAYDVSMKPGAFFSHNTALILYGCPIRASASVHVSVNYGRYAPRGKGIIGHRYRTPLRGNVVNGLAVVSPEHAIAQAARTLSHTELIVAADHLIRPGPYGGPARITPDDLHTALASMSLPGITKAREAVSLSRMGAESRMETLLRLKLEAEEITDLELQLEVFDEQGFVGRFDLGDRERRILYEYDGEQHRIHRAQYLKDQVRLDRARNAGWRVARFHYEDLFSGRDVFRRALRRGLGTRHE